jgi:hypothetical protein
MESLKLYAMDFARAFAALAIFGIPLLILINTMFSTKPINPLMVDWHSQERRLLTVESLDFDPTNRWRKIMFFSTNIVCESLVKPTVTESNGFWIIKIKAEEKK